MVETESLSTRRKTALKVYELLDVLYPESLGFLEAATMGAYQLLIATILSAQTTDRQVNRITPALFAVYPAPSDLAAAQQSDVEEIIRPTGYYRSKARNIIKTAQMLVDRYDGVVPKTMEELTELPGVGRKTAGVVLGAVFGKPAIIVDTHFRRVVQRLGLTHKKDPVRVEYEIADLLEPSHHYRFSMIINNHGRVVCHARNPECSVCVIAHLCCRNGLS